MSDDAKRRFEPVGDILKAYLKDSGLDTRVEAAAIIPEWPALVGARIAEVTQPLFVTADGTLFVAAKTHGWLTELQLMERELLRAINAQAGRPQVRRIRLQLMR